MLDTADIDVVIGGGGVAGTVVAAALHQLGYRILLIEPGLNDDRRLAGEVFHPPGVTGLDELGLLDSLMRGPVAPIKGFSVSSAADDGECIRLPYDQVRVSVMRGKRVIGIDQSDPSRVVVQVANGKATDQLRCRLLVAADGAQSRMGRSVGIGVRYRRISTMFGYRLATECLSEPDYGHVILGAPAPVLLYPISRTEARILFDIPHVSGRLPRAEDCADVVAMLSPRLRQEIERAVAEQPRMSVLAQAINADRMVQDRVVLVGDAGGSCHPLTASGMTRCVGDALLLRDALAERPADLAQALQLYQRRRRWPQATRLTLADALRDAFCGATPEARVVRRGILAYWQSSAASRAATMALLSTADGRPLALLREVVRVMATGFLAHLRAPMPPDDGGGMATYRIVIGLLAVALRHVKQILGNAPMSLRLRQNRTNTVGGGEQQHG